MDSGRAGRLSLAATLPVRGPCCGTRPSPQPCPERRDLCGRPLSSREAVRSHRGSQGISCRDGHGSWAVWVWVALKPTAREQCDHVAWGVPFSWAVPACHSRFGQKSSEPKFVWHWHVHLTKQKDQERDRCFCHWLFSLCQIMQHLRL